METAATRPAKSRRALAVSTGSAFFVLMHWTPLQHTGARRACALIHTGVWRGLGGRCTSGAAREIRERGARTGA